MRRVVLFTRYTKTEDAEILPLTPTTEQIFDQMVEEFQEYDPGMRITMLARLEMGDEDAFVCHVEHKGDRESLHDRLQAAYDECGVGGRFVTAAYEPLPRRVRLWAWEHPEWVALGVTVLVMIGFARLGWLS